MPESSPPVPEASGQASVTLAIPFEGHLAPASVISLARLVYRATRDGTLGGVVFDHGGMIDTVRNTLVAGILQAQWPTTHVMWVDPHLAVPGDAIASLLAHDKQIAGGVYPRWVDDAPETAYNLGPFRWLRDPRPELQRVGGLGLGCALVRADVYQRLDARHPDSQHHRRYYGSSEEVFFFERCREEGIESWLDPSVRCKNGFLVRGGGAGLSVTAQQVDDEIVARRAGAGQASSSQARDIRVAIAMPLAEPVSPLAMTSLMRLISGTSADGLLRGLFFTNGLFYDVARNALVSEILDSPEGFTHVFWVDSDMVVPPGALLRLLNAERPVVGGLYHHKRDLHPTVFDLGPLRPFQGRLEGLTRVDGFGLGCSLVERAVYEEMSAHFGDRRWHQVVQGAGEDVYFFQRCRQLGIDAFVDPSLRCGHVRDQPVTTAHWLAARRAASSGAADARGSVASGAQLSR